MARSPSPTSLPYLVNTKDDLADPPKSSRKLSDPRTTEPRSPPRTTIPHSPTRASPSPSSSSRPHIPPKSTARRASGSSMPLAEDDLFHARPRQPKIDTRTPSLSQAGSSSSRSSSMVYTPSSSALRGSAYSSRSSAYHTDGYQRQSTYFSDIETKKKQPPPARIDLAATHANGGLGIDFPNALDDTEDLHRGLEELSRFARSLPSPLPHNENDEIAWKPYEGLIEEEDKADPLLESVETSPFHVTRAPLPIIPSPPVKINSRSIATSSTLARQSSKSPRPDESDSESDAESQYSTDDENDAVRLSSGRSNERVYAYRQNSSSVPQSPTVPEEPSDPAGVLDLASSSLDDKTIPPNTTHLILSRSQSTSSISQLLVRSLPSLTSGLVVLDLSYCGLNEVPPAVASCVSLQELDIRGNELATGTLPPFLINCPSLRVLIADLCRISVLPHSLSPLRHLHTLSLRHNLLRSLPSWISRLASLHTLLVDGNPFHWHWANLVQPILRDPTSVPAFESSSSRSVSGRSPTIKGNSSPNPSSDGGTTRNSFEEDALNESTSGTGSSTKWGKVFKKVSMGKIRPSSAGGSSPRPPPLSDMRNNSLPVTAAEQSEATQQTTRRLPTRASPSKRYSYLKLDTQGPTLSAMIKATTSNTRSTTTTLDHRAGLRSIIAYLRDLDDLSAESPRSPSVPSPVRPRMNRSESNASVASSSHSRSGSVSPVLRRTFSRSASQSQVSPSVSSSQRNSAASAGAFAEDENLRGAQARDDSAKRALVVSEIIDTEKTYARGLKELCDIYVSTSTQVVSIGSKRDAVVPALERKAVFGNIEAIRDFHEKIFLPDLMRATKNKKDPLEAAVAVANAFVQHAAFLKIYSIYVNSFDSALTHLENWSTEPKTSSSASVKSSNSITKSPNVLVKSPSIPSSGDVTPVKELSSTRRKRIKAWLKRCRHHPSHSQISLESYLLLPVQRVPRYRLLLESLASVSPSSSDSTVPHPSVQTALDAISLVAAEMNERKRESEGRQMLLYWQSRIGNRFRSPLVQPHRSLIKHGTFTLVRTVKKASTFMDAALPSLSGAPPQAQDAGVVQIQSLHTELQQQELIALLCSDILVLVHQRKDAATNPHGPVELYTVMRLSNSSSQRAPPAKLFGSDSMLRLTCDTRAILYIRCEGRSDAISWMNAINLQHSLNAVA